MAKTNLCLEISYADMLEKATKVLVYDQNGNAVETDVSSVSTADIVVTPCMVTKDKTIALSSGEFTAKIGSFPEGTRFLTAETLDRLDYGYTSSEYKLTESATEGGFKFWHVSAMGGLNGPFGVFTTDTSGTYKVYALRKDTPNGKRNAKLAVNGTEFVFNSNPTKASEDFDFNSWFWDDGATANGAVATVKIKAGEPLLIQIAEGSNSYARIEAFAFVPVNQSPASLLYRDEN